MDLALPIPREGVILETSSAEPKNILGKVSMPPSQGSGALKGANILSSLPFNGSRNLRLGFLFVSWVLLCLFFFGTGEPTQGFAHAWQTL